MEVSILIGGEAGYGIRRAGRVISRLFARHGYYVFLYDVYPSLIRGGNNYCSIRVSDKKINDFVDRIDLLIALDEDTIKIHGKNLDKKGKIIFDKKISYGKRNALATPMGDFLAEIGGIPVMLSSSTMGVMAWMLGLPISLIEEVFNDEYGNKAEKNILLARKGYDYAQKNFDAIANMRKVNRNIPVITGNEAIALGAVKAGLEFYAAYPMTPSSSILHFLISEKDRFGITVLQPSNEIAAINMAIGAAYAGKKSMIASAGGGFALMQEAFSLAGMSETPLLVAECQRPAPSTGVPTQTAQGDLRFVLHTGHGEFPRIVVAPGDAEQAFYKTAEALSLAWKYQIPAIVLSDKHLSESAMSADIDEKKAMVAKAKLAGAKEGYKRYAITKDGVSPLAFPGTPNIFVKSCSYEHDETGIANEEADVVKAMQEKRFRKLPLIEKDLKKMQTVAVYGEKKSKNLIVSWGSPKGAILDAMELVKKPIKFLQIMYLAPFPTWAVEKELKAAKKVVCVENNYTAQLAGLIRENTGCMIKNKILRYDGRPFEPVQLAKEIKKVF